MSSVSPSSSASQVVESVQTFEQFAGIVSVLGLLPESERSAALSKSLSAYHAYLRKLGRSVVSVEGSQVSVGTGVSGVSSASATSKSSKTRGFRAGRWFVPRKLPGVPAALVAKRFASGVVSPVAEPAQVVRDRVLSPVVEGYCYLEAFREDVWQSVGAELGPNPDFFSLLVQPTGAYRQLWDPELILQKTSEGYHLVRSSSAGQKFWEVMSALASCSRTAVCDDSVWHVIRGRGFQTDVSPCDVVGASTAEMQTHVELFAEALAFPQTSTVVLVANSMSISGQDEQSSLLSVSSQAVCAVQTAGLSALVFPRGVLVEVDGVQYGGRPRAVVLLFSGRIEFMVDTVGGVTAGLLCAAQYACVRKLQGTTLSRFVDVEGSSLFESSVLLRGPFNDSRVDLRSLELVRNTERASSMLVSLDHRVHGFRSCGLRSYRVAVVGLRPRVVVVGDARLLWSTSRVIVEGNVTLSFESGDEDTGFAKLYHAVVAQEV